MATAAVIGVVWFLGVLVHARLRPLKPCSHCRATGRYPPGETARRICGRCGGAKEVRRWLAGPKTHRG